MAYTTEKISGNQMKLSFTVPTATFAEAVEKAYLKMRGRINVPGFRKGKAPRKLIESMYGTEVFYDEAFEIIFPQVYSEAVKQEELSVVDNPSVDIQEIGAGKDLVFTATVFVVPDVTLGDYKGLEAVKYLPPVTEAQIDKRIEQDVNKVVTAQEVSDRPIKEGDEINLNYAGSVDGVPFSGGTAEDQKLKIGSGAFIPGFEEQLVGLNVGDEKEITVVFPQEYHAEELAGKEAVFFVKINAIHEEVRPELDDDFAADVSEHATFAAYKEAIVKGLEDERNEQADAEMENDLIQQATDAADCDIPDAMVEREIDSQLRNMQMRMAYQGIRFEDYLKYTGMTEADVRVMFRTDAANHVKVELVLDAIRKQENIEATEEDVEAAIKRQAAKMNRDVEEFKKTLSDAQKENFKDIAEVHLVIDLLKSSAKVTEKNEAKPAPVSPEEVLSKTAEAVESAEGSIEE